MSSIVILRRQLVQPQGAEILSASNGTWQAEFVHGFANGADLTGHGYTLHTGASVVHEVYERGVRAYINNHAAGAAADIAISRGLYVAASEPFFSVVQYRTDPGSDGSGGLLCLRNTSANPICSMFVGPNGVAGLAGNATFIARDSSGSLSRHETTTAVNNGLMHTSAVRRFNGLWQWSLDGSPWADFATSPTNAQGAITFTPDRMFYGREPTGTAIGNIFQGFFEFGMVGRGTLNDAQIATVHQNPWLLFKQSPRRIYFDSAAVGGGPTPTTLTGRSLAASPTVTRGAISQTRVLTGRSLSNAPTLSRGAVVQGSVTTLTGRSLSAAPTVSRGAISQTRVLTGRSLANAPTITRAAISQDGSVQLTGRSLSAAPTVTRGAISQTRVLTGRSLANAPTVSRGAIEQGAVLELAGRDLTAAPTVTRGAIRQTHILAGRDLIALPSIYVPGQAGSLGALVATPQDRSLRLAVEPLGFTYDAEVAALLGVVTSAPLRAEVL